MAAKTRTPAAPGPGPWKRLGESAFCWAAAVAVVAEYSPPPAFMAVWTTAAAGAAGFYLGTKDRRFEIVVPCVVVPPLAGAWLGAYGVLDMYSPHSFVVSTAASLRLSSAAAWPLHAAALAAAALAGWRMARDLKKRP